MSVLGIAALLFLPQTPPSWPELAGEYDLAFERWVRAGERLEQGAEKPPHPSIEFWPRFERLADGGEGKATVWMVANLASQPKSPPRPAGELLARVRAGGEAEWADQALFELVASRGLFDAAALEALLEERAASSARPGLRAHAALSLAELVAARDSARAVHLRIRAARLIHQGVDLGPEEVLAREDLIDLAEKLVAAVERESSTHFDLAYRKGSDGDYYPVSGAPPDPEPLWRAAIEELATRGSARAQRWTLANAAWQLDEAGKQRLRGILEELVKGSMTEEELREFGSRIGGLVHRIGLPAVEPSVRALIERSSDASRPALLFHLGSAICQTAGEDAAQRERGLVLLREMRERWPGSELAKRAEGRIFRYTNLVVGKIAPDFETVDADGKPFKLSDYRGKVTVIDFWGFW